MMTPSKRTLFGWLLALPFVRRLPAVARDVPVVPVNPPGYWPGVQISNVWDSIPELFELDSQEFSRQFDVEPIPSTDA